MQIESPSRVVSPPPTFHSGVGSDCDPSLVRPYRSIVRTKRWKKRVQSGKVSNPQNTEIKGSDQKRVNEGTRVRNRFGFLGFLSLTLSLSLSLSFTHTTHKHSSLFLLFYTALVSLSLSIFSFRFKAFF